MNKNIEICKLYFDNLYTKTGLLNYMFGNSIVLVNSWNDLVTEKYFDHSVPFVLENVLIKTFLRYVAKEFNELTDSRRNYWMMYKILCKKNNRLKKDIAPFVNLKRRGPMAQEKVDKYMKETKYSRGTKVPSSGETLVMRFLDKLVKKYTFYYFYRQRWPFCKNKNTLEYDFYCVMTYNKYIIQFVIEYDGEQHFRQIGNYDHNGCHKHDILKQYYVSQLNIHMLRLNDGSNIKTSIIDFINKILVTNKYVIVNKIVAKKELFNDESDHKGLILFQKYCALMKQKSSIEPNILSDKKISALRRNTEYIDVDDVDSVEISDDITIDIDIDIDYDSDIDIDTDDNSDTDTDDDSDNDLLIKKTPKRRVNRKNIIVL